MITDAIDPLCLVLALRDRHDIRSMPMNLGHYNHGDYHYFSRIRSGADSLGELPSERFLDVSRD